MTIEVLVLADGLRCHPLELIAAASTARVMPEAITKRHGLLLAAAAEKLLDLYAAAAQATGVE